MNRSSLAAPAPLKVRIGLLRSFEESRGPRTMNSMLGGLIGGAALALLGEADKLVEGLAWWCSESFACLFGVGVMALDCIAMCRTSGTGFEVNSVAGGRGREK